MKWGLLLVWSHGLHPSFPMAFRVASFPHPFPLSPFSPPSLPPFLTSHGQFLLRCDPACCLLCLLMPDIHPCCPHTHCPTRLHGPLASGLRSRDQVPTGHVITASLLWFSYNAQEENGVHAVALYPPQATSDARRGVRGALFARTLSRSQWDRLLRSTGRDGLRVDP